MVMRVDLLSEVLAELTSQTGEARDSATSGTGAETFQFWSGASGECYVHSVFALIDCPELPKANVVLVKRSQDGCVEVLHVGETTHTSESMNRGHIRQLGARLGANEVHVHFLGGTERERAVVAFDLREALVEEALDAAQAN